MGKVESMGKFKIVEKFLSINGEGTKAGQLAVFLRFQGCNLNCGYCDTKWANEKEAPFVLMEEEELVSYVLEQNVQNVTLTGGEPLLQKGIESLIQSLLQKNMLIEIETNGSIEIAPFQKKNVILTMDYKLPSSGMEQCMKLENMELLRKEDTVKFVIGSTEDLETAKIIITKYGLTNRCHVYFSPVFGQIEPVEIVQFMEKYRLNGVNFQLQLHKFIWEPDKRGV